MVSETKLRLASQGMELKILGVSEEKLLGDYRRRRKNRSGPF